MFVFMICFLLVIVVQLFSISIINTTIFILLLFLLVLSLLVYVVLLRIKAKRDILLMEKKADYLWGFLSGKLTKRDYEKVLDDLNKK